MSRFEPNLRALGVTKWEQIRKKVDEASSKVPTDNDALAAEFNRLGRVTQFLAETVESAHPFADFVNPDIQNHVTNFESRINQLNSLQPSQLQGIIDQLNNEATVILDRLSPYLSKTETARAAGQAFGRYRRLIEAQENDIHQIRKAIDKNLASASSATDAITTFRIELFEGTDEKKSIQSEIQENISQINKMLSATDSFYRKLKEGGSESASIENQIVQAQTKADDDSNKITELLRATKSKLTELDRIHFEVVGPKSDTDDDSNEGGLQAQLEARNTQLNTMASDFEVKFKSLTEQIEGLLPGATSAGLATAYNKRRTKAEKDARFYSSAFFVGIFLLAILATITITHSFSLRPFSWEFSSFVSAKDYLDKVLPKLPFLLPVLWATLTVSKRRSEMHRLAEEYAHKEALAQSYEGFKQQINEMGKEKDPLIQRLLEVILKAISVNAATTLEGKHGEKMPAQEVLEEVVKKAVGK